jgi:hypothetical protein
VDVARRLQRRGVGRFDVEFARLALVEVHRRVAFFSASSSGFAWNASGQTPMMPWPEVVTQTSLVAAVGLSFILQWFGLALNGSGQRIWPTIIPNGGVTVGSVTIDIMEEGSDIVHVKIDIPKSIRWENLKSADIGYKIQQILEMFQKAKVDD